MAARHHVRVRALTQRFQPHHRLFAQILELLFRSFHRAEGRDPLRMHQKQIATDQMAQPEVGIGFNQRIGFRLRSTQVVGGEFLVDFDQQCFRIGFGGRRRHDGRILRQ